MIGGELLLPGGEHLPLGSVPCDADHLDAGAQDPSRGKEPRLQGLRQRRHGGGQGMHPGARTARGTAPDPPHRRGERTVLGQPPAQLRGRGGELEGRRIGGVDSADHRCDQAFEHLLAQAAAHHVGDGRPGTGTEGGGQEPFEGRAQRPRGAQHRPHICGERARGDPQQAPTGCAVRPGLGDHPAAQALARSDDLLGQAQLGDQGVDSPGPRRVGLRTGVQREVPGVREGGLRDRAADGARGLEQHHPVSGAQMPTRGEQPGQAAADDEDAAGHARCAPCSCR